MKLSALSLLALTGLVHAESAGSFGSDDSQSGLLRGSFLPNNAVLRNVVIPSYDDQLRLTSSMHFNQIIIHDQKTNVEGLGMNVDFYSPAKIRTGFVAFEKATFNPAEQILTTLQPFHLVSDQLDATGTSLILDVRGQRAYANGPITADAALKKEDAMNTIRLSNPFAYGAALVAAATVTYAAPAQRGDKLTEAQEMIARARPTDEELAKINAAALTARPDAQEARDSASNFEKVSAASELKMRDAMGEFASYVALTSLSTAVTAAGDDHEPVPPPPPLEGTPTHITADDGFFIDRAKGLLVFIKNVKVKDTSGIGDMEGADELKIFFKTPPPEAKDGKGADKSGATEDKPDLDEAALAKMKAAKAAKGGSGGMGGDIGSGMGDVEKIIATGKAVVVRRKSAVEGEKPMMASGRMIVYEPGSKEILIKGGSPWIQAKNLNARVLGEDGYIRYNTETGNGVTGGGILDGNVNLKQVDGKDKDDKKKDKDKNKNTPAPANRGAAPNPGRGH